MNQDTKAKIAFFDFTGCEGCQLTVIDSLQDYPELLAAVEIVQFREAMSTKGEDYHIAFVEGSYSKPEDEERLIQIRHAAQFVIALGACAHLGGVNALRNWHSQDVVGKTVYGGMAKRFSASSIKPINALISVDGYIPGCPINKEEFIHTVKEFLLTGLLQLPDYPVCVECKLNETQCVFFENKLCLGSITRAGCGAICPSYSQPCDGCRGMVSNPNIFGLSQAVYEHGLDNDAIEDKIKTFQTCQFFEMVDK